MPRGGSAGVGGTRKPLVLVVEDDSGVLASVEGLLADELGEVVRVEACASGEEALAAAAEEDRPLALAIVDHAIG